MMGSKRPSDSDPTLAAKLPKLEPGISNDFSGSVKKKLASSSRTGQACDRCKVRYESLNNVSWRRLQMHPPNVASLFGDHSST